VVIFVPNIYARMFGFALMGTGQLKNSTSYLWMFENLETKLKSTCCGVMNFVDTITLAIMCSYFMFFPNWFYLEITMTSLCVLSYFCLVVFMPESPKWHLIKGNMDGALKSFDAIARLNRSKNRIPRNSVFVEFIIAKNTEPC
jgi:hypothetical protein